MPIPATPSNIIAQLAAFRNGGRAKRHPKLFEISKPRLV